MASSSNVCVRGHDDESLQRILSIHSLPGHPRRCINGYDVSEISRPLSLS